MILLHINTTSTAVLNQTMYILDLNGKIIGEYRLGFNNKIKVDELENGVYIIRIVTKSGQVNYRFIKM